MSERQGKHAQRLCAAENDCKLKKPNVADGRDEKSRI